MLRRTFTALLTLGVGACVALGPAVTAHAQAGVTLFTVDRMDLVPYSQANYTLVKATPFQALYDEVTLAASAPPNGIRLVDSSGAALVLAPPAGQAFVVGSSFPVAAQPTSSQGTFVPSMGCGYAYNYLGPGDATVLDVTYTGGALTSLAADIKWQCSYEGEWRYQRSSVRYASTVPYNLVRGRVISGDVFALPGTTTPLTVRLDNLGSAPATLGATALDLIDRASYVIDADGCSNRVLQPGEGCEVDLTFRPKWNGWYGGLLQVPVAGYHRAAGLPVRLGGRGVPVPRTAYEAKLLPAIDGVVIITNFHDSTTGGTTAYEFVRRPDAGSPWTVLATLPIPGQYESLGHLDTTIAPGASAEYALRALGPMGVSEYSTPLPGSRPTETPPTGDLNAFAHDFGGRVPADVLEAGADVTFAAGPTGVWIHSSDGSWWVATLPVGVHKFVSGGAQVHSVGGCDLYGDVTVTTALFDATGAPTAYTADFVGTCSGRPATYSIRYRSVLPYQGIMVTQPSASWVAKVGSSTDRTFTLASRGTASVTLGTASITGAHSADYSVVASACASVTLARADTCTITVRAKPSARGARTASLRVSADTLLGFRNIPLTAQGAVTPTMRAGLDVYRVAGRARLWWSGVSDDGGSPVTGYRVYRAGASGTWVLLGTAPPVTAYGAHDYLDATATPGASFTYGVAAVTAIGTGPKVVGVAALSPRTEVVFTRGADNEAWGLYAANEAAQVGSVPIGGGGSGFFEVSADGSDHYTPSASPDGRRLVYSAPTGRQGYGLWVRSFATGQTRLLTTMSGHEIEPDWSPDGRTIAFTSVPTTGARSVWTVPAAGGTPTRRATAAADPSWHPDSETLTVVDMGASLRLLHVSVAGTRVAVPGTSNGRDPAVSPDGRWLAFSHWSTRQRWDLSVLPIGGGSARFVQSNANAYEPFWRGDSRRLYHTLELEGSRGIGWFGWQPETAGGFAGVGSLTAGSNGDASGGTYRSLGVHLTSAPHTSSPTASIDFAVSAPVSGESFMCALDNAAATPCASPWTRSGLSAGRHRLEIRSRAAGMQETVAVHSWVVDAAPPVVSFRAPSAVTLKDTVAVAYTAPGAASYDVRHRLATSTGYSAYVHRPDDQATVATSTSVVVSPGAEVCFSVRARDAVGNVSAWTPDRCTSVPFDDRALSASPAWQRTSPATAYRATLTGAMTRGAVLVREGVTASRVYLVASRCPECGSVDVSIGGVLIGRVSLAGPGAERVVLPLPAQGTPRTGTLRITAVSSAPVRIDGVGLLRR